ncbi:hypothetical protein LTR56_015121 [Elasticomyces elasticus]|nr:hypothetical protein LTR56_015121 [Elasticomyces elasticus]KAK3651963.1 hypothetical protein LTR22_011893 [Elasticomyces elasticus]KAK4919084.1 hypothetical protein LTR49_013255 [Elasticomyces elasticus]KAK5765684.1 hypothetical protein LTS12_004190 [Elasticomyces elasticus]
MRATWTNIGQSELLQRSSHNVAVLGSKIYVFGGELKPRQPRDNDIFVLDTGDEEPIAATATFVDSTGSRRPSPRVGSAVAKLGNRLYFFSGRGGEAMAPVDEQGALWVFDTVEASWTLEYLSDTKAYPEARSYHAMTSDGKSILYVHAGCPEKGRLSDLWAYDINKQEWEELASAPEPSRGGPSIAYAEGKLWRMNGFDGKQEVGGSVDVYEPKSDAWTSIPFNADGQSGPGARSVGALLPVKISGKTYLTTLFGESDPSSLGHQGAGKMLSDIWVYDITAGTWEQIVADVQGGQAPPASRGWFDADVIETSTGEAVAVSGGLDEQNERLGDTWLLTFAS